jgi:hypothetical protein
MDNHIRACSACSAELEEVTYVRDQLRLLKPPELPTALQMRVDLECAPAHLTLAELFSRRISLPVPVALLIAALLLLPALFLAVRDRKTPQQSVVRVEVPVERIVVQTVTPATPPRVQKRRVSNRRAWPPDNSSVATRLGNDPLQGFRPPETANIRVVKDSER